MASQSPHRYARCFISAPSGIDLGALPNVLEERGISWEWAKPDSHINRDASLGIASADFVLVVLNGTRADYRAAFEAGIAIGLRRPVLLIQTKAVALPLDLRRFTTFKANLSNRDALRFHIDLFLATPPSTQSAVGTERSAIDLPTRRPRSREVGLRFESDIERRVYDAVIAAGGSVTAQPQSPKDVRFRPDMLAWLGHLDAEWLDPVIIEVKGRIEPKNVRGLEEQLLHFMEAARARMALVVTAPDDFERDRQVLPNVIWLAVDEFETLARTERLGDYVRDTRNRIMHGVR